MAIIWGLRSDNASFNARHSVAGVAGTPVYTNVANIPQYAVDATALGGNNFSLDRGSATAAALVYPARGVFSNQAFSLLMRIKLAANGTFGLFEINPGGPWLANSMLMFMVSNWRLNMVNEVPTTIFASTLFGTAPATGVWLDMVVTWDGTTSVNSMKIWIDGVNVASVTPSAVASNPKDPNKTSMISIGGVTGAASTRFLLNEFVIWDTVINPASVALVGGTGSLDGAARTNFVDVTAFDGSLNADPGIANVRNATGYTIAGVAKTGTAAIPSAANVRSGTATDATTGTLAVPSAGDVRSGVAVDAGTGSLVAPSLANTKVGVAGDGGTGTYDGTDRHTDPGEANVRSGTAYKSNSTSNNKTGTAAIPAASHVRDGTAIDATVGTLAVPIAADVREGEDVDATVGTLVTPSLANTKIGVAGDGGTGTYDGSDRWSDPGQSNVLSGVLYKANSLTNNRVGALGEQEYAGPSVPANSVGIKDAFNLVTRLHSRPAYLRRLGSPDLYSPIRITPSNFFRHAQAPGHVVIRGREFIIPKDVLVGTQTQLITFDAVPTEGAFHLTHLTDTASIEFDATNEDVQTALRAISGLEDIVVTGDFTDGFLVKFFGVKTPLLLTASLDSPPLDAEITISISEGIPMSPLLKRGDQIQDADIGHMAIDEVIELYGFGGQVIGFRVRTD